MKVIICGNLIDLEYIYRVGEVKYMHNICGDGFFGFNIYFLNMFMIMFFELLIFPSKKHLSFI